MKAKTKTNTVSQFDLARLATLAATLENMRAEYSDLQEYLTYQLSSGGKVEQGPRTAFLKSHERRSVAWKSVVVRLKGEGYASNVLSHTKPTVITKLIVK
jgi:hypothetical protein